MNPCVARILASTIPLAVRNKLVRITQEVIIHQNTRFYALERGTRSSDKIIVVFQVPDVHGSAHGTLFVTYTMFDDGQIFDSVIHSTLEDIRQGWRDTIDYGNRMKTPYTRIL